MEVWLARIIHLVKVENPKKVISPPLDYSTIIAETTQFRQVLRINLNKINEVKPLSAFEHLLRYVNYFFLRERG